MELRKADVLVAEYLFDKRVDGETLMQSVVFEDGYAGWQKLPEYTNSSTHVPELLDILSTIGRWAISRDENGAFKVNLKIDSLPSGSAHSNLTIIRDTLPHALCAAALIGKDVPGAFKA